MAEQVRYVYHCAACGNTGEVDFPDDSHEGEVAACAEPCGAPVTLKRDDSPDNFPFWFEGGAGSPHWRVITSESDPVRRLRASIDADEWLKPGKTAFWKEAALALCGCYPGDARTADPLAYVDGSLQDACKRLFELFETEPNPSLRRTLVAWAAVARKNQATYHPHFDTLMHEYGVELPTGEAALSATDAVAPSAAAGKPRPKKRRDILTDPIEKAIEKAGSDDTAPVYLALKEMALGGEDPFSGEVAEGGGLRYTNDRNEKSDKTVLTKDALDARLRRRRREGADAYRR